ncbi:Imm8 family immunity protein [Nocardia veterana]|uniref:Immunity protein 8 of polymorphic toxin system n=1 Tax=Nocardia veterana TaxID=132249 RepID=A0A7X6RJJ3_9NOCA|nr:Imm8 family immunity protein [Nocardia veterana]NKY87649.1 hypothetical protein [Nocardia veterana]
MKAELKGMHSPDVDLTDESADIPTDSLLVQLMIGPANAPGEESFDVVVCTPDHLARTGTTPTRHTMVLDRIEIATIRRYVENALRDLTRPTWHELATEISRIGRWEFDDYRS